MIEVISIFGFIAAAFIASVGLDKLSGFFSRHYAELVSKADAKKSNTTTNDSSDIRKVRFYSGLPSEQGKANMFDDEHI
ncbi:hypothetical protein [Curvibacter lanceolatus]|uniref:hypothetical protein n=1 Tax=Curvibacter lanceolatus TaxID=86182 RepID=UPI0012FAC475|nr:hypothetical protein [Curvibacter lanceolatus]